MSRVMEHRLVRRSGMLGVFGLLLIPALIAIAPSVALASCATDFPADAGCKYAEKWGSYSVGTLPGSGWSYGGGTTAVNGDSVTTPGINGDPQKLTFTMHPPNGSGHDCLGCPRADVGRPELVIPNGTRIWYEWWTSFSSDFNWGCGGGGTGTEDGNCSMKVFAPESSSDRLLFINTSFSGQPHNVAYPVWSIYPNYAPGGTDSDGVNRLTERGGNVNGTLTYQAGHFYRNIFELLVGQGTTGAYKFWVCPDGGTCVKTHDFSGLQTTSVSGFNAYALAIGGPAAGPNANSTWSFGSIRWTTTNISPETPPAAPTAGTPPAAPTAGTPPAAPTSLVVQ